MIRFGAVAALIAAVFLTAPAFAAGGPLGMDANAAFLAANAKKPGVIITPSGLQYRIIHSGYGARPTGVDDVTCGYKGALINGTVFASTEPGLPESFTVNKLIAGWAEALQLMREGDEWELVIPAKLAYGTRGAGEGAIPPNQVLVFDLQLIKVTRAQPKKEGEDQDDSGNQQQ
jgi:FKBP-type peptidyl-prolyl cis-trans isomerase